MPVKSEQLKGLLNPNLPYKTRKGQGGKHFSYITMRQAQMLFDVVCGVENWTCEFREIGTRLFCRIGINIEGQGWVYKEDCGSDSNIEAEKGGVSDAFKRAAVHWGVGRFLYPEVTEPIKRMWHEGIKAAEKALEAPVSDNAPAPKEKPAPAPKKATKRKDLTEGQNKMTVERSEAIIKEAQKLGWDSKALGEWLKDEHNKKWKDMTNNIADKVIKQLREFNSQGDGTWHEHLQSIEDMTANLTENGGLSIERAEKLSKAITGFEYLDETHVGMVDLDMMVKLRNALLAISNCEKASEVQKNLKDFGVE